MSTRAWVLGCMLYAAVASTACDGGTITVPCDETRCQETCVSEGNESGTCAGDEGSEMCICRAALDVPPGAGVGLSSGGVVRRESGRFQVEMTVGPVAPAAQRTGTDREVDLGVQPQTDPARARPEQ